MQGYGMDVHHGGERRSVASKSLHSRNDIDIVLMDIMMPEMDGYETIRRIRADDRIADIPIIALTAKAMKRRPRGCITAGASEYMSKPVDMDHLTSLLKIWLNK